MSVQLEQKIRRENHLIWWLGSCRTSTVLVNMRCLIHTDIFFQDMWVCIVYSTLKVAFTASKHKCKCRSKCLLWNHVNTTWGTMSSGAEYEMRSKFLFMEVANPITYRPMISKLLWPAVAEISLVSRESGRRITGRDESKTKENFSNEHTQHEKSKIDFFEFILSMRMSCSWITAWMRPE